MLNSSGWLCSYKPGSVTVSRDCFIVPLTYCKLLAEMEIAELSRRAKEFCFKGEL
jgi:hypothetical protein